MSTELQEQFWERVVAFEEAEWTTSFDQLVQGGMELPAPEALDDSQLSAKLWEVIRGLAMLRTFLYCTDHLSDRELYEELWHEVLREETPDMPVNEDSACHIDLVGSGSEQDNELYLRYYADEEDRRRWAKDWPNDVMPKHEPLPYDRDRHLPSHNKKSGSCRSGMLFMPDISKLHESHAFRTCPLRLITDYQNVKQRKAMSGLG
ncbi:hypothetical protein V3O24_08245 [Methylobacter sp. Wu8]|uniref:hypothetical protein n=1 Tax=Methylobacter sp. Wu8 TaxID=3118457 RepID=UPI002F325A9F